MRLQRGSVINKQLCKISTNLLEDPSFGFRIMRLPYFSDFHTGPSTIASLWFDCFEGVPLALFSVVSMHSLIGLSQSIIISLPPPSMVLFLKSHSTCLDSKYRIRTLFLSFGSVSSLLSPAKMESGIRAFVTRQSVGDTQWRTLSRERAEGDWRQFAATQNQLDFKLIVSFRYCWHLAPSEGVLQRQTIACL